MRTLLVLALIAVTACKGKPKHRPPPPDFTPKTAGSAAPDIVLPHGDGSPPKKTSEPLPMAKLTNLARAAFRGFQLTPIAIDAVKGVEMRQRTEDHPRIYATIVIARCGNGGILGNCFPLDPAEWKKREAEIKASLLVTELRDLPDTKFELGGTKLREVPIMFAYYLGLKPAPAGAGSGFGSGLGSGSGFRAFPHEAHGYTVYYNDGINQIRVSADYGDTPKATQQELLAEVGRDDLEAVAKAFLDIYTQLW